MSKEFGLNGILKGRFGGGRDKDDDTSIDIEHGAKKKGILRNFDSSFQSSSASLMSEDRYEVGQDVYGLIFISPVTSPSFIYAFLVVGVKLTLLALLLWDQYRQATVENSIFIEKDKLVRATQFLLLPIAIALQEDLIYVYTRIANIKYSKEILEEIPSATQSKFALSFALRLLDGMAALTTNFVLILTTETVLQCFLNFAATHFIQGIDDVAFQMAHEGFLGDRMEDRCRVVEETTMARRVGDSFTNALDSILFLTTYFCMVGVWVYVYLFEQKILEQI